MTELKDRIAFLLDQKLNGNWAELARCSGLTPSTVQQIKNGADPRVSTLKRIAQALNASVSWLLTGEGPMFLGEKEKKEDSPDLMGKINALLEDMDEDRKREVLRYTEEKKLLDELLSGKRNCC